MPFSITGYFALNCLAQAGVLLLLTPLIAREANQDAGLFDFIITGTYLVFLSLFVNGGALLAFAGLHKLKKFRKALPYLAVFGQAAWTGLLVGSFYLFFRLGIHLDHPVVADLARLRDGNWGVIVSTGFVALGVFLFFVLIGLQMGLVRAATPSRSRAILRLFQGRNLVRFCTLSAIFGAYFAFIAAEGDMGSVKYSSMPGATFLTRMVSDSLVASLRPEEFPEASVPLPKRPDVVIVMADAFRFDVITPELSPHLHRLLGKRHCAPASRHYPGSHMTSYGGFSLWHGMNSYLYRPMTERNRKSLVLKTLRDNGYRLGAFDASGLTSYHPPVVHPNQFDEYLTFVDREKGAREDEDAVSAFLDRWGRREKSKPYTGFIFLYSTHEPYSSPTPPSAPTTDQRRFYDESVRFVDRQVGRVLEALSPETIFIFTGDHGEEFGEFGSAGHASVRFEDVRVRTPLIFCLPGHSWPRFPLSSHADIWPTIFDWSGAPVDWLESSFSGRSLLRESRWRKWIPLTGAYFPSNGRELALVLPEGKIKLHAFGSRPAELKITGRLSPQDQPHRPPLPGEESAFTEFRQEMIRVFH